jgi:hypothetical protein
MIKKLLQIIQQRQEGLEKDLKKILPKQVFIGLESYLGSPDRLLTITTTSQQSLDMVMSILRYRSPYLHFIITKDESGDINIRTNEERHDFTEDMATIEKMKADALARLMVGKGRFPRIERIYVTDRHLKTRENYFAKNSA